MKAKIVFFLLGMILSLSMYSQTYDEYMVKVDSLIDIEEYYNAYDVYTEMLDHGVILTATRADFASFILEDPDFALIDYDYLVFVDPDDVFYRWMRASSRADILDFAGALEDYEYILEIEPEDEKTIKRQEACEKEYSEYLENIKCFDDISVEFLKKFETEPKKSKSKQGLDAYLLQIDSLTHLIEQNEEDYVSFYNRAVCYVETGEVQKGYDDINKALEIYPNYVEGLKIRAYIRHEFDAFDAAAADYSKLIHIQPNESEWYGFRALAYLDLELNSRSIRDIEKAIILDQNCGDCYLVRGLLRYIEGDYKGAKKDYNKQIELDPNNAQTYMDRGEFYYYYGSFRKSNKDFEKALELDNERSYAYYSIGMNYYEMGKMSKACKAFTKAVELGDSYSQEMIKECCE